MVSVHFPDGFCLGCLERLISCEYKDCDWLATTEPIAIEFLHVTLLKTPAIFPKRHWKTADAIDKQSYEFNNQVKSLAILYDCFLFKYE